MKKIVLFALLIPVPRALFADPVELSTARVAVSDIALSPSSAAEAVVSESTETATVAETVDTPSEEEARDFALGLEYFKNKILKARAALALEQSSSTVDGLEEPGAGPVLDLTLEDAIQGVVYFNPSVEKARLDWLASLQDAKAAWGDFEPALAGEYKHNDLKRRNSSLETVNQLGNQEYFEQSDAYSLGLEGKTGTGGDYRVGYSLTGTKNTFTGDGQDVTTFSGVTANQPLLRGAWNGVPRAGVSVGKINRRASFHAFRAQLTRILYEAETSYWALVFASVKLRMTRDSVDVGRKIAEDARERLKTGKMSALELEEAEAGLAERLGAEADARQEWVDAMNRLKLVLSSDRIDRTISLRAVTPLREPPDVGEEPPFDQAQLESILRVHPSYQAQQAEWEREKVLLATKKDERLPEMNLNGSLGYNGLGRSQDASKEDMKKGEHPAWSAGVQLRLPILAGVKERGGVAAQELRVNSAQENLKAVEYEIASSLPALRRRVAALRDRIRNSRSVADYRRRLLDAEILRMTAGKSNTRLVFEVEEKLAAARENELESLVRCREAAAQLAVLSGSYLSEKGFEKLEAGRPILSESLIRR